MTIVARDDAERARTSRRRSYDDVVDDGHVVAGGRNRLRERSENVSSGILRDGEKRGSAPFARGGGATGFQG